MLELGVGHLVWFIAMVFSALSAVALVTTVKHFDAGQDASPENASVQSVPSKAA
jgi:hypothetical protein